MSGSQCYDLITGGVGRDVFQLKVGQGTDTITDFSAEDNLMLSSGLGISKLTFSGNDIIFTRTNEVIATLIGVETSTIAMEQFI